MSAIATSSDRATWLKAREGGIGASEAAALMGASPWMSPAQLWVSKVIGAEELEGERLEWGTRLEPVIIGAYSEPRYAGRAVIMSGELLRCEAHPWALATLDAWTVLEDGTKIPLEIKTVSAYMDGAWEEGPPRHYQWQCQHQMLVTGAPRCSIACLIGGQRLVWCDIERDELMIALLVEQGAKFWASVEAARVAGDITPPSWLSLDAAAVSRLWPDGDGSTVELDDEIARASDEEQRIAAQIKGLEEERKALRDRIAGAIGPHSKALFSDGSGYTYKEQSRKETVIKASTSRVLRRFAAKGAK